VEQEQMKNYKSGIESKRKLYESAKRHFLKDGYQNALIRDIVADAESKLGLFTYYYDSKAAVAGEVCQELFANVKKGIKEILESLSLEQEELLYEMVHYRCWYRCIQSRADVERLWNECVHLAVFEYANFDRRKEHLWALVTKTERAKFLPEVELTEGYLSVITSISIGIEKQLYGDLSTGRLKITFDEAVDAFFEFFYSKIIADKQEVNRCIDLSRDISNHIRYVVEDDLSVKLTLDPEFRVVLEG
jgi:AcrR family transcriptional regulator